MFYIIWTSSKQTWAHKKYVKLLLQRHKSAWNVQIGIPYWIWSLVDLNKLPVSSVRECMFLYGTAKKCNQRKTRNLLPALQNIILTLTSRMWRLMYLLLFLIILAECFISTRKVAEKLWIPHLWRSSRPGWMGPWST